MSQSSEVSRGGRRGYTGSNRRGRGGEQQSTLILYQDDPPRGHHPTHTGEARAARGRSGSRAGRALPADPPQERAGVIEAVSSPPRTQENLLGTSPKTSKRRSSSSRKPSPSPRPSVASISSRSTLSPEASPPAASPAADAESMPSALKVQPPAQVVVNSQVAKASTREGVPGRKEHIESDRNVGAGEEKASRKEVVVEDKPLPDRKSRLAPANQLALIGRGDSGSAATSRRPSFVQKFASNRGVRALALAGVGALVSSGMWTGPGDENVVSFEAGQNRPSVAGLHSSHATAGEIYSDGPSENPDFQHRNTNTYEKHGIDLDGLDDDFWRRHNLLETSHGSREGENRNTASSAAASNRFAWTDYLPNILTDGEADPLKQDLDRDLRFENGVSYADEGVAVPPQADLISDGGRIWWRSDTENCRHNKEGLATCSAAELSACRASELCSKWKMEEDARNFVPTPMTVDPTLLIGLGTTTAMLAYNMRSRTPDQAQPQAQPQTADKKPEAGVSAAGPGAEKKAAENEKSKLSCAAGGSGATAGKEEKSETNTTEDERPGDPMDVDYSASDINVLTVDTEGAAPGDAATAATCAGVDRKAGVALSIAGKSVSASTSETGAATGLPASREKILQHVPGNKEGTMTNESNKGEVQGAGTIATAASTSNFGNIARGSAAPLMQAGGIAEFSRQLQDREPIGFPVPPATPPGAFAPYSHAEDTDGTVSFLTHGNVSTSRHRNPGSSTELSSPAQSFPTTSLPSNTLAAGAAPVQTKRRRSNSRHERWKGSMEDTNTGTSVLDEMTHAPLLEAIKKGEPTPTYSPYRNRLRRGVDPYASAASRKVRNRKNQNRG
ncbi:unnamed protein product [Amoebophrya sp. A120]|nr:unnamed protein product [Amoebophrya sp. A120]|eukprot:GSA120T00006134001.1